MPDTTTSYTNCLRIERTDGIIICLTELDKDLEIDDSAIGLAGSTHTYLSAAGYTPTNVQQTSDNAVNNADVEGVLTSIGVQREDIIGGRYDFAKLHIFIWDFKYNTVVKRLGSGHWGEVTLKDGSYTAEFRSLSQQLQQTIGRTYNPECDEQLGGSRCGIALGIFNRPNGAVTAQTSNSIFTDTTKIEADDFYNGMTLTWTSGDNDTITTLIESFSGGEFTLNPEAPNVIAYGDAYSIDSGTYTGSVNVYGANKSKIIDSGLPVTIYDGMYLEFSSGENNGDYRTISSSLPQGELTVSSPFDYNILGDDEYMIINMAGETYMSLGEVTSVTDSQTFEATITDNGSFGDDYFNYGKLKFTSGLNDNIHMEVKNFVESSNKFKLFLPMPFQIEVGDRFHVFAGCDKRLSTCKDKFSNHINFQGFPYIPGTDQISKFGGQ